MTVSRREALNRMGALGLGAILLPPLAEASQAVPSGPVAAATVTVSSSVAGVIGPGFAGFSYEKSQMAKPFFSSQNANAIGLFRLVGPGLLRIGGNSVDKTTWAPAGSGLTSGLVSPPDIDSLAGFLKATGWQVLYGVNLAQSTPELAAAEVAYAVQALGPYLYGIEIGNEVDLYAGKYFPSTWGYPDYLALWRSFVDAIRQQSPHVPLTGPVAAYNTSKFVAPFANDEGRNVVLLSDHYYRANGQLATSNIALLVSPDPNIVKQAQAMLAISMSAGVPYRFAETNSFYNGGSPNVSDSYGSALWVIDHLFACALNGCQGINLHGGGNGTGYTPIADSNGAVVAARPEFYGVTLFTLAGQGLLQETSISAGGLNATAYTVRAANGALNIIINNKDQTQNLNVTIQLPQASMSAQLLQMTGPSLDATTGVAIQGSAIQADGSFQPGAAMALQTSGTALQCYVGPMTAVLVQLSAPAAPPPAIASSAWASTVAAPGSLATAYGNDLAGAVSIQDSAGVTYPVTPGYASAGQINFEVPEAVSIGAAIVTIGTQKAALQIATTAPGLFTLNGAGLAAAYAIRVAPDGAQSAIAVFATQGDSCVAVPVNVDPTLGQVFLILFGTGIRGAAEVEVTINGLPASVTYSGAQGTDVGLDQVNVVIPPQVAGSGSVSIALTAGLSTSNAVTVDIL